MPESRRLLLLSLATSMVLWSGLSEAQQKPTTTRARPMTATTKTTANAKTTPTTTPRPVAAQTRDPFVGVWMLNPQTSKYETGGPPKRLTRTYEDRGGGTIFMTTDVVTAQGTAYSYLVYKRDGKPYPEAAVGAESVRLVIVRSIDPRTEELYFYVDGKPSDKPSTITISADGMTMTQVVTVRNSKGQPFTNTVVYDKQP
jgi:hypothetical protein